MKKVVLLVCVFGLVAAAGGIQAAPLTFFGEDLGKGEATPLSQAEQVNSDAARAAFFANLVGVGTETFEGIAIGSTAPLGVNFGAAGTATLNGQGFVASVPVGSTNGVGRYSVNGGTRFWDASTSQANFTINFSAPVAAFGFYGIDVGDFNGQLQIQLVNGGTQTITIPHTVGAPGGSILYFGIISEVDFTSVTFTNTNPAGGDFFAFDDFSIGSRQQVVIIPEPATLALLGLGLAGAGLARRRRKS